MKFETPKIIISMFNTEDVITTSSAEVDKIAEVNAVTRTKMGVANNNIFIFTF